jgi:hypothetical protein
MATLTFDTLKFVKRLKDAGFNENQAEAISEALQAVQEIGLTDLVTRRDWKEVENVLKHDMKELELRIENKLEAKRGEITLLKWMMGFVLAGIVSLVLKAFFLS